MIPRLFDNSTIPVLEQVVGFTQARHAVLAGNVANANTPGYRVRDLSVQSFQTHLRDAIAALRAPQPPATAGRLDVAGGSASPTIAQASRQGHAAFDEVREDLKNILYHDESNVDLEQQVNELNKNKSRHDTAIAILRSQFGLLQAAISERA